MLKGVDWLENPGVLGIQAFLRKTAISGKSDGAVNAIQMVREARALEKAPVRCRDLFEFAGQAQTASSCFKSLCIKAPWILALLFTNNKSLLSILPTQALLSNHYPRNCLFLD